MSTAKDPDEIDMTLVLVHHTLFGGLIVHHARNFMTPSPFYILETPAGTSSRQTSATWSEK